MEQSPSWEANWFSASQEIPRILWKPKVHYRSHKYFVSKHDTFVNVSPELQAGGQPLVGFHSYLFIMSEATCFGPHKAETCSLPHNTYDVFDVKGFKFILTIRLITHRDVYSQTNIWPYAETDHVFP